MTQPKEDFSQRMIDILNAGALNLAIAIGYRTRLFDAMAESRKPLEAAEIASKACLNDRYVQEWLGIMTAGAIVEANRSEAGRLQYRLPEKNAAVLTRKAGNANLAVYAQEIPLLTNCSMEAVVDAFQSGEGISYDNYPKFQAFMSELSNAKHKQVLVDKFLPTVDKGKMVSRLQKGIRVCDFGCGEGIALILMAQAFPRSRFVGIDISTEAILKAREDLTSKKIKNADFRIQDAATIKNDPAMQATFDYIVAFDAIHDQTAPLAALQSARHMLSPEGIFSMIDIAAESDHLANKDHPMGPFLYTVSLMHCMPVGLVNGGSGLGMMWGRQKAVAMLKEAGFEQIEVLKMQDDPFNLHYQCRK